MKAVLKMSGLALLMAGIAGSAMAAVVPEIDPGTGSMRWPSWAARL